MPENPKSPRDQFIDDVLDASLRNYGRVEPMLGLEARVMRRVNAAPKHSWFDLRHLSAAAAFAAVLVAAVALISIQTAPPKPPRFNKTIEPEQRQSQTSGIRPQKTDLPPCKPGEQSNAAPQKKSGTRNQPAPRQQDCVPAPPQRHQPQTVRPPN